MRIFVGLTLPEEVRETLSRLYAGIEGARWISQENYHLTLHFIGELHRGEGEEIDAALEKISLPAFELTLSGVGYFGKKRGPRALWVGAERNKSLKELHERVGSAIKRAGIELEGRKFKPHVTLARLKQANIHDLGVFIERNGDFSLPPIPVENFVLFRSHLGHTGAHYEPLAEYALRAN